MRPLGAPAVTSRNAARRRNATSLRDGSEGFSLPEVLIALALVTVALTGFAVLLAAIAGNHRVTTETLEAEALLSDEVSYVQSLRYDDIIMTTGSVVDTCNITNTTTAAVVAVPSVNSNSEPVARGGLWYSVDRTVTWYSDPSATVTCDGGSVEARDDIKVVTVTVSWQDRGGNARSRTAYVYASPYTNQGRNHEVLP